MTKFLRPVSKKQTIFRFVSQKKDVSCVFITDKAAESNPHSLAYPLLLYHTTVALCSMGNLVHLAYVA